MWRKVLLNTSILWFDESQESRSLLTFIKQATPQGEGCKKELISMGSLLILPISKVAPAEDTAEMSKSVVVEMKGYPHSNSVRYVLLSVCHWPKVTPQASTAEWIFEPGSPKS